MSRMLQVQGATHPGNVHPKNEDSHAVVRLPDGGQLLVVCDGMGGMGRGDQASQLAVQVIEKAFLEATGTVRERLRAAIRAADEAVRATLCVGGQGCPGSTAVLVHVDQGVAHVAWVGDSRAYLVRDGRVVERTRDHKLVQDLVDSGQLTPEEARRSTLGSVITRALGGNPPGVNVSQPAELEKPWELLPGDRVLLCSDGLCDLVTDAEMPRLVGADAPRSATERLVQAAVDRGGHDNITVVLAAFDDRTALATMPVFDLSAPMEEARRLSVGLVATMVVSAGAVAWALVQAARMLR
jgi:serine/threonine protein phosphatase PrpC